MATETKPQAPETTAPDSPKPGYEIALSLIYPNPDQPRKVFPRESLEELALSIKEQGLIEPLVVVPKGEKFMLIAGERRWRAAGFPSAGHVRLRVQPVRRGRGDHLDGDAADHAAGGRELPGHREARDVLGNWLIFAEDDLVAGSWVVVDGDDVERPTLGVKALPEALEALDRAVTAWS